MADMHAVSRRVYAAVQRHALFFRQLAQAFFVGHLIYGAAPRQFINNIHRTRSFYRYIYGYAKSIFTVLIILIRHASVNKSLKPRAAFFVLRSPALKPFKHSRPRQAGHHRRGYDGSFGRHQRRPVRKGQGSDKQGHGKADAAQHAGS